MVHFYIIGVYSRGPVNSKVKRRLQLNRMSLEMRTYGLNAAKRVKRNKLMKIIHAYMLNIEEVEEDILKLKKKIREADDENDECIFDDDNDDWLSKKKKRMVEEMEEMNKTLDYLSMEYYKLTFMPTIARPPLAGTYVGGGRKCIEHFTDNACYNYFRFNRDDLIELIRCLGLERNGKLRLNNGAYLRYEEVVLFSLHRFSTEGGTFQQSANLIFDGTRHYSVYCRAFNWFCEYIIERFEKLLTDNLDYWVEYFPLFADSIRKKVNSMCQYPEGHAKYFYYEFDDFTIALFFDCCVSEIARPGSGPLEGGGPGAPRDRVGVNGNLTTLQQAFFNNWKKYHGLKHLTIENCFGMCTYIWGPDSFIRNDNRLVNESGINNLLWECQQGRRRIYSVYGDRIFVSTRCVSRAFTGDVTPQQLHINSCMSAVRIANEWDYGLTSKKFPFINTPNKMKILKHSNVKNYYKIATLLRNANACCYGTEASLYFNLTPPSLSNYFHV